MEIKRKKNRDRYSGNKQQAVMRKIRVDDTGKLRRGETQMTFGHTSHPFNSATSDLGTDHFAKQQQTDHHLKHELAEIRLLLKAVHERPVVTHSLQSLRDAKDTAVDLGQSVVGDAMSGARITRRRATKLGAELGAAAIGIAAQRGRGAMEVMHGSANALVGGVARKASGGGTVLRTLAQIKRDDEGVLREEDEGEFEEAKEEERGGGRQQQHEELQRTVHQLSAQVAESTRLLQQLVGAAAGAGAGSLAIKGPSSVSARSASPTRTPVIRMREV
jgi:hypothetical protein